MGLVAHIQKWGNSQELRIARAILEDTRVSVGDEVEVPAHGVITMRPVKPAHKRHNLDALPARVPKGHKTAEEDWDGPRGKKSWQVAAFFPKKGDYLFADFDPQPGHEQKGRRPAGRLGRRAPDKALQNFGRPTSRCVSRSQSGPATGYRRVASGKRERPNERAAAAPPVR